MRRTIIFFALAFMTIFMFVSCQGPHTHTFGEEWKYDSVNHWHAATCEHTEEVIDKAPHDFEEKITKVGTENDEKTLTCRICGFEKTETVPHVHTYSSEWTKDENHHWHASTCSHTDAVSDKAEHTFDDGVLKTEPGAVTTGLITYTCKVCGYEKNVITDALGAQENTVSYTGALSRDYDGNSLTLDSSKVERNGNGAISFMYKKESEEDSVYSETSPSDAGSYSVKISVAATPEWKAAETVITYTINKAVFPLHELEITYQVLPDAAGTGIDSYKSKTFRAEDGLPEGVTVTVYPYNKNEDGTFTVGSSGESNYLIKGTATRESLLNALQSSNTIPEDELYAYVELGSNYTLPSDSEVAFLKVNPLKLNVSGKLEATKEYDEGDKIIVEDLSSLSSETGINLSDYSAVVTMESAASGAAIDKDKSVYLKHKTTGEENYNFYIAAEDIEATIKKREITIPYYIPTPMFESGTEGTIGYRFVELGYEDSSGTVRTVEVEINPTPGSFTAETTLPITLFDLYCENDNYTFKLTQALKTENTSRFKIYKNCEDSSFTELTDTFTQVFMASSPTGGAVKEACYKFTAAEGEEFRITYSGNPLYIALWDKNGKSYYLDNSVTEGVSNFTSPAAGTYYIISLASTDAYIWMKNNIDKTAAATFKFSKIAAE